MSELIQLTVDDAVAVVRLNRPDKYNALNTQMVNGLQTAFKTIAKDNTVRAVIFASSGKGFCAGQDLTEFEAIREQGISVGDHLRAGYNALILQMRSLGKPIVCAVNGVAAGAGASLTLGCDLRIAAADASFVFGAFLGIGLVPDSGATVLLPRLIGETRALELMLLNDNNHRLSAQQAHQWGLVNRVVLSDQLESEAVAIARRLVALPPLAVSLTKQAAYTNAQRSLPAALEYEAQVQQTAANTQDHQEGIQAFLEKRPPVFTGN